MARYVSNLRPQRAPIFAFTASDEVYRQLSLYWGTFPVRIDFADDPNQTIESAEQYLRQNKLATRGNRLVIISDIQWGRTLVDCIQLRIAE